jgi:hypothetical protein
MTRIVRLALICAVLLGSVAGGAALLLSTGTPAQAGCPANNPGCGY